MANNDIQVVCGYTADLYCGECNRHTTVAGRDKRECKTNARRDGWLVDWGKRVARCPVHSGIKPKRYKGQTYSVLEIKAMIN